MKKELDKIIETLEAMTTLSESIYSLVKELKHFSDTMIHARIELIEKDIEKLKKYRFDSRIMKGDELSTALPIQLGKEEIKRVIDEQDDALIYN